MDHLFYSALPIVPDSVHVPTARTDCLPEILSPRMERYLIIMEKLRTSRGTRNNEHGNTLPHNFFYNVLSNSVSGNGDTDYFI